VRTSFSFCGSFSTSSRLQEVVWNIVEARDPQHIREFCQPQSPIPLTAKVTVHNIPLSATYTSVAVLQQVASKPLYDLQVHGRYTDVQSLKVGGLYRLLRYRWNCMPSPSLRQIKDASLFRGGRHICPSAVCPFLGRRKTG